MRTKTSAHHGKPSQDLTWRTPKTQGGHAKITSTASGTEASSVITLSDRSTPADYDFAVTPPAGTILQPNDEGGVDVLEVSPNGGAYSVGVFEAPWAKDANGKNLPTTYTLSGNTITQHIDASGAAYPVTADPHYTWGIITGTAYYSRWETQRMMYVGGASAFFVSLCAVFTGLICGIPGGILDLWTAIASIANSNGECSQD